MFNPHFLHNVKRVNLCAKIDSRYPIFTLERDIYLQLQSNERGTTK